MRFFFQVNSHPTFQAELCATLLAVGIFLTAPCFFKHRLAVQLAERIVVYELYNSGGADSKGQGNTIKDVYILEMKFGSENRIYI